MNNPEIKITGCTDCPFSYEYDMGPGYGCRLDSKIRGQEAMLNPKHVQQNKKYQPITPAWCPLTKVNYTLKFDHNP